ncbi:MAG: transcription-repair coupling factor, partial [Rickettsiales bacterium]|nr:transcription-repair coupling factor [Rickettsiales bacterium]
RDALVEYLTLQGYRRSGKAMEPGEFAVRGGIIDLIPSGSTDGIRIDLFGDDIESLRSFDPLTQLTETTVEELMLYPMSEVLLSQKSVEHFRENYRTLFGAVHKEDPLYESISDSRPFPGMEHWLPLFYDSTDTLFDYCAASLVTMNAEVPATVAERLETIRDYYDARVTANKTSKKNSFAAGSIYHPIPPDRLFLNEAGWAAHLAGCANALFSPFHEAQGSAIAVGYRPAMRFAQGSERTPFQQLEDTAGLMAGKNKSTLIACYTEGSRARLQTLLMERSFHVVLLDDWKNARDIKGKTIGLITLPLETGFESDKALILSEQDVLGERIARARKKKRPSDVFLAESANFAEGELVVHKEHGIGRFEGLVTLTVSGAAHDCLKIIYDGDDKLFLPVENIEMVSSFGLEDEGVKLDKLGGASWQARKSKLKQRIKIAAEALLKTAAMRLLRKGEICEIPTGAYEDFCARFPYMETDDQARAIEEVLEDLHSGKPMDRLICGDVGFGKTEVALRAAFIAAMGGTDRKMQVAVIAPTTLLARQHYKNFKERFTGFPVEVRQLSRMVPAKAQKDIREELAEGKVDIVIGTHALLSKQVQFKHLGLLIVDEEQHFGVGQKEKLKELKSGIHVLTLSATPIPRTLQMALTGVRDLSLITTPPIDRLAIRSFVMPFDPVVTKEAIQREIHRNGQCFLVTPRIKDIADLKQQITELVPNARMAVAHGQMPASDLDRIMNEFYDAKYDILLSTAIIESGLDIPTANTMLIHNAHLFGLAQLYQMRGRVGRGKTRAYAYFMLPHHRTLTKGATRRLEVIQTLDTLGAGFTLASHDMDIRGFGNLVGEEQSGHIKEVGMELYQQMLEDAVAKVKANKGITQD